MNYIDITIATEDALSEAVAEKILSQSNNGYNVVSRLGKRGFAYLKSKISKFNNAKGINFLVITDQDTGCPPQKIKDWLPDTVNPRLIFRIAVMEIEAWVMADCSAFASFFGISENKIPTPTDGIRNPKEHLIKLVSHSRNKNIRADIIPTKNSTARVGPAYNPRLIQFVREKWEVQAARKNSHSLDRACYRIDTFGSLARENE